MRRTKAFTLIELMVVVSIIALLAMMLVPALQRALEMTRRANCVANLKGAGTALALYAQNYDNSYPMIPGSGWDTVVDGSAANYISTKGPFKAGTADDWTTGRSVTSLMFMLIRNGESPKLFCCPSDSAKPDVQTTDSANNGAFNWDFSCGSTTSGTPGGVRNTSYSYQCPITRGSGTQDLNGIPSSPDASMVVMADRTPANANAVPVTGSASPGGVFNGNSTTAWTATVTADKIHLYNSQNHTSGEMMNVMFVDGHAASVRTPNAGPTVSSTGVADCIFSDTAALSTTTDDGIDYNGTLTNTTHAGKRDTYLWGSAGK